MTIYGECEAGFTGKWGEFGLEVVESLLVGFTFTGERVFP